MNFYVEEKLREFKNERLANQLYIEPDRPRRRPLFGGVIALAGRTLRRAGEGLEGWADVPCVDRERRFGERVTR